MATAVEMVAAESGGVVTEDVIKRLFKITAVERPFIDRIGTTDADNYKKEFLDKKLAAPSATNAAFENQDLSAVSNSHFGNRYYNLCQQPVKVLKLSQRGRDVKPFYTSDEYLQQLMDLGEELRLDEEAAAVSRNAATEEVAATSGALMAGAATWAIHNATGARGAGGADAVLDGTTGAGGGPTTAPVAGTARAMTETLLRLALKTGWDEGAAYNLLMSTGEAIEQVSNYMFTSTARVATLQSDVSQSNRTGVGGGEGNGGGNGSAAGGVVAQGSVTRFAALVA